MLAKLASARNKPNKQTIVTLRATDEMLASLPMRSIRGLGGKLGERVESLLTTALNVGPGGARRRRARVVVRGRVHRGDAVEVDPRGAHERGV